MNVKNNPDRLFSVIRFDPERLPLILRGARQVGKTWLAREFGRTSFSRVVYTNFDTDEVMRKRFERSIEIPSLIQDLGLKDGGSPINPDKTLLIFDEVQESPRALTSLKYFCEDASEYAVVAAGSLFGVTLHPGTSFPLGKVAFLDVHPMTFLEFLDAIGEERFADILRNHDWSTATTFGSSYRNWLRHYYYVGGMPEAVQSFADNKDFTEVREIQKRILDAYEQDFSKHAPLTAVPRLRMLWSSLLIQLARENKKFMYNLTTIILIHISKNILIFILF